MSTYRDLACAPPRLSSLFWQHSGNCSCMKMYSRFPIPRNTSNTIHSTQGQTPYQTLKILSPVMMEMTFSKCYFILIFGPTLRCIPFTTRLRTALDTPLNRSEPLPLLFVRDFFFFFFYSRLFTSFSAVLLHLTCAMIAIVYKV